MSRLPGLIATTLFSMALLAPEPIAFAATTDPIAETNDSVSDNAVATENAEANTDEPIIIDLDVLISKRFLPSRRPPLSRECRSNW